MHKQIVGVETEHIEGRSFRFEYDPDSMTMIAEVVEEPEVITVYTCDFKSGSATAKMIYTGTGLPLGDANIVDNTLREFIIMSNMRNTMSRADILII